MRGNRVLMVVMVLFVLATGAILVKAVRTADALRASCDPPQPIVIIPPTADDKAERCAQLLEGTQAVNELCLKRLRVCLGVPP